MRDNKRFSKSFDRMGMELVGKTSSEVLDKLVSWGFSDPEVAEIMHLAGSLYGVTSKACWQDVSEYIRSTIETTSRLEDSISRRKERLGWGDDGMFHFNTEG